MDCEDVYKPISPTYGDELKSMAGLYGYAAEDVDAMMEQGITPEEIEEYFYQVNLDRYF